MSASDLLRAKYTSDRHLAMAAQNAFGGVMQSARGVASDIYSGVERASWYSSCLIPKYNDVCQELKKEEIRMVYSIHSIYRYRDVIAQMLIIYFKLISKDVKDGNEGGSAQNFIRKVTGVLTQIRVAGGTRYAFSEAASQALAHSNLMSKIVVERIAAKAPKAVFGLQYFGMEQKVALAARHLKAMYPDYYWALYEAKLEMLYYFAEPIIEPMIKKTLSGALATLDDLADFLSEDFGV